MFKRKKGTVKPNLPKEYVWALEVEGEDHEYKCLVTETEVITYEDGREHKHLKITNPTCMEGVLQIDCETKLFGDMVPFQLERFIPYIKLEGGWIMSDTTRADRMEEQIAIYKKESKLECMVGILFFLIVLAIRLITGEVGDWWMLTVFGVFFLASAGMRMARLRNELNEMKEAAQEAAAEETAMKAYLEDKAPEFHKTEEE